MCSGRFCLPLNFIRRKENEEVSCPAAHYEHVPRPCSLRSARLQRKLRLQKALHPPLPAETTAPADATAAPAEGPFRIGLECNYAPFNWTQTESTQSSVPIFEGGYADGYDIQIAKIVAQGLGRELEVHKIEWDGLIPALLAGKIDAIIAGMSPREDRKVTIDFSEPYYTSDLVIVVKKDSAFCLCKEHCRFLRGEDRRPAQYRT